MTEPEHSATSVDAQVVRRALARPAPAIVLEEARPAAVILPIVLDPAGARVVVIVRGAHLRDHADEAGFPGGKPDPSDASLEATALRELTEEVGTRAADVEVLGALTAVPVIDRRFLIHPFVALAAERATFRVASSEVSAVYALRLEPILAGTRPYFAVRATWRGTEALAPYFALADDELVDGTRAAAPRTVYGATAYVLYELLIRLADALGTALPPPVIVDEKPWGDRYRRFDR